MTRISEMTPAAGVTGDELVEVSVPVYDIDDNIVGYETRSVATFDIGATARVNYQPGNAVSFRFGDADEVFIDSTGPEYVSFTASGIPAAGEAFVATITIPQRFPDFTPAIDLTAADTNVSVSFDGTFNQLDNVNPLGIGLYRLSVSAGFDLTQPLVEWFSTGIIELMTVSGWSVVPDVVPLVRTYTSDPNTLALYIANNSVSQFGDVSSTTFKGKLAFSAQAVRPA